MIIRLNQEARALMAWKRVDVSLPLTLEGSNLLALCSDLFALCRDLRVMFLRNLNQLFNLFIVGHNAAGKRVQKFSKSVQLLFEGHS